MSTRQKPFIIFTFLLICFGFGLRGNSQSANPGSPCLLSLGDNLVKVEHDNGEYQVYNTTPIHSNRSAAKKIIQFNIAEYDTEEFTKFKSFTKVPIGYEAYPALPTDTDEDLLIELTGIYKDFNDNIPVLSSVYEQISRFSPNYTSILSDFSDYYSALSLITDINQNGKSELVFRHSVLEKLKVYLEFYESPKKGKLATEKIISHLMFEEASMAQFPQEVDLDRDGRKEILYMGSQFDSTGISNIYTYIAEYIDSLKTLERVWSIKYQTEHPGSIAGDWAVGDFDMDGKSEVVTGDIDGNVFWIEHTGVDNDYQLLSTDKVYFLNVYYFTEGDDLDGDGRPECFVGGAGFIDDIWTTILLCYETIGDNQFEETLEIQIIGAGGLGSTPNLLQADVTGDGNEELVFFLGGTVLVFNATGDDIYEISWLKEIDVWIGGAIGDATGDNINDLICGYKTIQGSNYATTSEIYTIDSVNTKVTLTEANVLDDFELLPSYPNPFNSSIKIRWRQEKNSEIRLDIYNTLGCKVKSLANDLFRRGSHSVIWNGRDDFDYSVASGIYFLKFQIGNGEKVQKNIFTK